jgi:hypothetical protein
MKNRVGNFKNPSLYKVAKLKFWFLNNVIELVFSFIFSSIFVLGYILTTYNDLGSAPMNKQILVVYLCGAIVVWVILFLLFRAMRKIIDRHTTSSNQPFVKKLSDRKLWFLSSLIIFLFYCPIIFLSFSELTPDSWNGINQSLGNIALSNAHPVIFTAIVSVFVHIGLLFGSIEWGILLFSIAQSMMLALIFAYVIVWMKRERIGKNMILATVLFYAVLPINAIAGIVMWKDILFAGFGLLFLLCLQQLYVKQSQFFTKKSVLLFILFAFLFCVWRNNGFYVYVFSTILMLIISRKALFHLKGILLLLTPIAIYIIYSAIIATIARPSPATEMFSVPLQQIARTVKYHGSTISEEDRAMIGEILPVDKLGELYNPNVSDPVKNSFNLNRFNSDKGRYIGLWTRLLVNHKKPFVASFLYSTYGYVYPFYPSTTATDTLGDNAIHIGVLPNYSDSPYISGTKKAIIAYRDLLNSIVPLFHNIGFYFCIMLFGLYGAIVRQRKELTGVFIVLLGVFLTTSFGPVNGEFRYLYLYVIATPFILSSVYLTKHNQRRISHGKKNAR